MLRTNIKKPQNEANPNRAAFQKVAKELKECAGLVVRGEKAKRRAVEIIANYMKTIPHGEKGIYLGNLCREAGISEATLDRWKSDVKEDAQIGDAVLHEAEKHSRTITTPFRKALLEASAENPDAPAIEVFQKACTIADAPKATKAEIQPIQGLRNALAEYLDATNDDVQGVLSAVKSMNVSTDVICKAFREICK